MNKLTITFTAPDGKQEVWEFKPEEYQVTTQRGFKRRHAPDGPVTDIEWTGQRRWVIKAWKGCSSFDSFTSDGL